MREFTESLPFILTFLGATLVLQVFAGEKITYYFLVLVLLSMIVINADKFKNLLGRVASYGK